MVDLADSVVERDDSDPRAYAGVGAGPLRPGERVTLTDAKGRKHSVLLAEGGVFHTSKGGIAHDDLIGGPEGVVVHSPGGTAYLALRPLLADVHRDDAARRGGRLPQGRRSDRDGGADIFPGARVIEAGVGSGALTMLPAAGDRADRSADLVRAARRLRRHRADERGELPRPDRTRLGPAGGRPGRAAGRRPAGAGRPGRPRHARAVGLRRRRRRGAGAGRRALRLRGHHHPAGPDGGDAPGPQRVHRAGGDASRWSAAGTPRDWPYAPSTRWSATPAS